jgi:hypothetical protein
LEHFANARKRTLDAIKDDKERPMHTLSKESTHSPLKIDATMAAVLAWEARGDCIAAGAYIGDDVAQDEPARPKQWQPGMALPASAIVGGRGQEVGPMGSMS